MIELIGQPACLRSKKIKQWLREREIPFEERPLYSLMLDEAKLDSLIKNADIHDICDSLSLAPYLLDSLSLYKSLENRKRESAVMEKGADAKQEEDQSETPQPPASDAQKTPSSARLRQMRRDLVRIRKFLQANPSQMRRPIVLMDEAKTVQEREWAAQIEQLLKRQQQIDDCRRHCPNCQLCFAARTAPDFPSLIVCRKKEEEESAESEGMPDQI